MYENDVRMSEEMYTSSHPIMYASRLCGLFPCEIRKKGSQLYLERSKKYLVYSFFIGVVLVTLTIKGLVDDVKAGSANSVRMKEKTGKYVTCGDISIVALLVFIGIFGFPFRIAKFWQFIECLNEVDSIIVVSDSKNARNSSLTTLSIFLLIASVIIGYDLATWWRIGGKSEDSEFLVANYIPFYISYYIVIMIECQYMHMISGLTRRLRLINSCLESDSSAAGDVRVLENRAFSVYKESSRDYVIVDVMDLLTKHRGVVEAFFVQKAGRFCSQATPSIYVRNLMKAYLKICDAGDIVNTCCGMPILVVIVSCLLHLIITPYFLVLEITGRSNVMFATLQLTWLVAHICRLAMIVEPCYGCILEAKKTRPLVCKLLCYGFDADVVTQLELFSSELYHRQIEFTACGLVTIDRFLVTGIAGAVTTYLVILIQFQKSEQ